MSSLGHHPLSTFPISAIDQGVATPAEATPGPYVIGQAVARASAMAAMVVAAIIIRGSPDAAPAPAEASPRPIVVQSTVLSRAQAPIIIKGPGEDIFFAPFAPRIVVQALARAPSNSAPILVRGEHSERFPKPIIVSQALAPPIRISAAIIVRGSLQDAPVETSPRPVVVLSTIGPRAQAPTILRGSLQDAPQETTPGPWVTKPSFARPPSAFPPIFTARGSLEDFASPKPVIVLAPPTTRFLIGAILSRASLEDAVVVTATPQPVVVQIRISLKAQPPIVLRGSLEDAAQETTPKPVLIGQALAPLPQTARPVVVRGGEDAPITPTESSPKPVIVQAPAPPIRLVATIIIRGGVPVVVKPSGGIKRRPHRRDLEDFDLEIPTCEISGGVFVPALQADGRVALGATVNGLDIRFPVLNVEGTIRHIRPAKPDAVAAPLDAVVAPDKVAEAAAPSAHIVEASNEAAADHDDIFEAIDAIEAIEAVEAVEAIRAIEATRRRLKRL